MPEQLTIYTTPWCGYCRRLERQLDRAGIGYVDIDIERDERAAAFVQAAGGGNQTVPTVVLPAGTVLTNPTFAEVTEAMRRSD